MFWPNIDTVASAKDTRSLRRQGTRQTRTPWDHPAIGTLGTAAAPSSLAVAGAPAQALRPQALALWQQAAPPRSASRALPVQAEPPSYIPCAPVQPPDRSVVCRAAGAAGAPAARACGMDTCTAMQRARVRRAHAHAEPEVRDRVKTGWTGV
eukprot:COSAG02_NODE_1091_length_14628_cov_1693.422810_6_plen_152_part_00